MGKTSKKKLKLLNRRLAKENKNDGLFSNPVAKRALENMSIEEKEKYRKIGEELYGNVDFNTGEIKQEVDATADLIALIRSGLHPKELSGEELGFLSSSLGSEWYKKFGYTKEDIDGKKTT